MFNISFPKERETIVIAELTINWFSVTVATTDGKAAASYRESSSLQRWLLLGR